MMKTLFNNNSIFSILILISISISTLASISILASPAFSQEQNLKLAQTKTVCVIGSSSASSANIEKARDAAISESLISAVYQVAFELLPPNAMSGHFAEINKKLFTAGHAFVQNYKVLAEYPSETIYRVLVEATISVEGLKKHLTDSGLLADAKSLPSILFLISEKPGIDSAPKFWWGVDSPSYKPEAENAISIILKEAGYNVTDHQLLTLPRDAMELGQKHSLNNEDALMLGIYSNAGILIVGESSIEKSANVMGTGKKTFKATVSVRAVSVEGGNEIAASTKTATIADIDEIKGNTAALTEASKLAGNELLSKLDTIYKTAQKSSGQITLAVEGTGDLSKMVFFRKALSEMPGVNMITIKEMSQNEASIAVDYQGNSQNLADDLMLKTFDSFGINIYEITKDILKIKIVEAGQKN
jgi:hypothetical protein